MPAMSRLEAAICSSGGWSLLAQRAILPWALRGAELTGGAIEVGAGGGAMAAEVLERFPRLKLTATDVDAEMVARARGRLERFGERALVAQADATALPFPDAAFDVGLSFLMLHHVGRWEQALAELARVVRPGGQLFVYDLLDAVPNRLAHRLSRSEVRLIEAGQLPLVLEALPLRATSVRHRTGLLFRAHARRG
jgi:ubiquinone/menaquinone biosynthesis C-methylase UbiE